MQRRSVAIGLAALAASAAMGAPSALIASGAALDRTGVNTVRIFAYRISLEQANDREKLGLVAQELRSRAEAAERRWRDARDAARIARARHAESAARVMRLEQIAAQREAEFAQIIEQLTEELAAKDVDYKRRLAMAIADGTKLLESDEGRRAIELIALGGVKNISAGLDALDAAAAIADKMDNLRKAERYRQRARVNLGVRGIGSATTEKIIGLFETVVANDPESYRDWLELVRLYRDANKLEASVKAADQAQRWAQTDGERAIAIIDRADTHLLQLRNEEAILTLRKMTTEMLVVTGLGREKLAALPAAEKGRMALDLMHEVVDAIVILSGATMSAVDDYKKADSLLANADSSLSDAERLRWRAKCSLRIALTYSAKIKIDLIRFFQVTLKRALPPRGTAMTDSQFVDLMRKINIDGSFAEFKSNPDNHFVDNMTALQKQTEDIFSKLDSLDKIDKSIATRLETAEALCQLLAMLGSFGLFSRANTDWLNNLVSSKLDALIAEHPDLVPAKRAKANYLFITGVTASQGNDAARALKRLNEANAIYTDLVLHDPSSAVDRRAAARTMGRLAEIEGSGVSQQSALAAYEKLRADGMLAPADESEFSMIEMGAKTGLPVPLMFAGAQ